MAAPALVLGGQLFTISVKTLRGSIRVTGLDSDLQVEQLKDMLHDKFGVAEQPFPPAEKQRLVRSPPSIELNCWQSRLATNKPPASHTGIQSTAIGRRNAAGTWHQLWRYSSCDQPASLRPSTSE